VPQISAIARVAKALEGTGVPVIGDGGIRYSGDIAKAIAAGAHTRDDRRHVRRHRGVSRERWNCIRAPRTRRIAAWARWGPWPRHGSSDRYFQDTTTELEKLVPEGIEGRVPYKGSLVAILHQLSGGLRAAMGYTGSGSIEEMRTRPQFVRITTAGVRESHVHDVTITKEAPNYRIG
jgi:IMP dehydrogenase